MEFSGYLPYLTLEGTPRAEGLRLKFGTGATFNTVPVGDYSFAKRETLEALPTRGRLEH